MEELFRAFVIGVLIGGGPLQALDTDGDGIPDDWEDSHFMDKNNPDDASFDFDRDGLNALQEHELDLEGIGEGPLGVWSVDLINLDFMNRPGSSTNRKEIVDFNDRGDVLINVKSWTFVPGSPSTFYYRVWFLNGSDGSWRTLSSVGGQEPGLLLARDLNNEGVIVGQAQGASFNAGAAFGFMKDMRAPTFDENVNVWLNPGAQSAFDLVGINDFGEVIGTDTAGDAYFESLTFGSVSCPSSWVAPVFTAINNWGEVAGIEYADYWGVGAPRHFLMSPGWSWLSDFPAFDMNLLDPEGGEVEDDFDASFRPTWLNDWGEFGGNYAIDLDHDSWAQGAWYFDGFAHDATTSGTDPSVHYRDLLPEVYSFQSIRGLNDWPQILVSGSTDEEEAESFDVFLLNGPLRVPFSAFAPHADLTNHSYEWSMPASINNRGMIAGWTHYGNKLYLLGLDQDDDGDGMPNDWETFHALDPTDPSDALLDSDGDWIINRTEFFLGSAPTPSGFRVALDVDGDGLPDAWERSVFSTLAKSPDLDDDQDGLSNWEEWVMGTDPTSKDSDGDGLWDDLEVLYYGSDPNLADTDGDGIPDGPEDLGGSSPTDPNDVPRFPPYLVLETRYSVGGSFVKHQDKLYPDPFYSYANWRFWDQVEAASFTYWNDNAPDNQPYVGSRLFAPYPGTEDYRTTVLRVRELNGEVVSAEVGQFEVPAGSSQSNLVTTEADEEGETEYLLPVEVVSRDKFLAGSFSIPSGWDSLEMEFVGPDGSLGKYGNLLGGGSTKIYDKVEDIMADSDYAAGGQVATQKVWFVKDSTDARKINYYTCFDSTGEVKIKLYLNGKPESLGEITHTLTAAPDFAAVIDYVDQWVKGTSFDFTGGVITPPLAMRSASAQSSVSEGIHNLTRAALIPFFNVVNNVEGLGSVAFGLFDGIKEGVSDDYKLLVLIKSGVLGAGGWAIQAAEAELNKWRDDPLKRAAELKKAADRLCQEWVFKPMETVQADLSTWEGFKKRSWQTWKSVEGTANKAWVLTQSSWGSIKTGLKDWVNDFADRMMEGAEKAHWSENLLVMDKIGGDANEVTRQASYTFGYTFGYISEQVAVGILTGGTVKIGAVMTKGGTAFAAQLAARRVLPVVARLQFVKKWAASVAISIEMKVAVERGLIIAAETPLSLAVKDSAAEVIERGMKRATFERTAFSNSKVLDEVIAALNIKKLILTPGREGQFWYKFALFFEVMGEKATAPASKGWVKFYNRLLEFEGDILRSDRAGDALTLFRAESSDAGKTALKKSLDEFGATDGAGKLWLRDVEKIQAEGYRYSSYNPKFDRNNIEIPGPPILRSNDAPVGGWYASFDKLENTATAKNRFQLPDAPNGNTAKYRLEFDWEAVKNNVRVARGRLHTAEWFEALAKDYPENGLGGGTQMVVDGVDIPIKKVWDISGSNPIQVYP